MTLYISVFGHYELHCDTDECWSYETSEDLASGKVKHWYKKQKLPKGWSQEANNDGPATHRCPSCEKTHG